MWGLSTVRTWLVTASVVALGACGGGGSAGDSVFGGGGGSSDSPTISGLKLVTTNSNGAPISSISNGGTETVTVRVTAVDANNRVVSGAQVDFSVDSEAVVAPAATVTDEQGVITAQVGIGTNRSNRQVNIVATANGGAVIAAASILVTGADLTGSAPPVAAPGAPITAEYTLVDGSQNPMVGQLVTLMAGGTEVGTVATNSTGKSTFTFNAPATSGALALVATAAGVTDERFVQVQASTVPDAIGPITSPSVSVNPSVVSANATGSANATTVTALFKGANNAAIANVRVWFTLPDPNSVGGRMGNNGLVYSDATGRATTTYIPGPNFSPTDGVVVLACYSTTDFAIPTTPGACPAGVSSRQATLTVVDDALRVSIGTDELIGLGTGTYTKDFTVTVVDSRNAAKADVEVTPKLDLTGFYKGYFLWDGDKWSRDSLSGGGVLFGNYDGSACPNEDVNRNGVKDGSEDNAAAGGGNGNGELDPAGVSITIVGSSKTDSSGKVTVRIEYPRDRATWIDFEIAVTARVSGSEGLALYRGKLTGLGNLRAPGAAFTTEDVTPAFAISPYGRSIGCDNTN